MVKRQKAAAAAFGIRDPKVSSSLEHFDDE